LACKTVPKTNSNASASTGMVLIEISFFILVFIEIFSYFMGIFVKVTIEKHMCTYYTTTYISQKLRQISSFTSFTSPPFAKNSVDSRPFGFPFDFAQGYG